MELLMTTPNMGIITLLILAVVIFFQVIIHNTQETKRFNQLNDQIRKLEEKIEKLTSQ
jgi:cell division protein FtsB